MIVTMKNSSIRWHGNSNRAGSLEVYPPRTYYDILISGFMVDNSRGIIL